MPLDELADAPEPGDPRVRARPVWRNATMVLAFSFAERQERLHLDEPLAELAAYFRRNPQFRIRTWSG